MFDVICVGEILIDMIPIDTDLYNIRFGGAPMNCAVACARLGLHVGAIAAVGEDPLGQFLLNTLKNKNVDISRVRIVKGKRTTLAFVVKLQEGERAFFFYRKPWLPTADTEIILKEEDYNYVRNTKIVHISGFALSQEPARSNILKLVEYAYKNNIVISFDPTYRPDVWENVDIMKKTYRIVMTKAHIMLATLSEYEALLGIRSIDKIIHRLVAMGIKLVGIKMGKKGSLLAMGRKAYRMRAYKVPVKDTVGAGDAWNAGVLYGYLKGYSPMEIIRIANAIASIKCMYVGAIEGLPSLEEAKKLVKEQDYVRPEEIRID